MAGIVDLHQKEGHALCARPLQHGQPIGGLLEGDLKARTQNVDIILRALRGGEEGGIGHHQRMRAIARKLETGDAARLRRRETQRLEFGDDRLMAGDRYGLHGDLAELVIGR
ncbi:hypothetical protein D9M70_603160 [compost metagenome]